jgi:hypothetical protein
VAGTQAAPDLRIETKIRVVHRILAEICAPLQLGDYTLTVLQHGVRREHHTPTCPLQPQAQIDVVGGGCQRVVETADRVERGLWQSHARAGDAREILVQPRPVVIASQNQRVTGGESQFTTDITQASSRRALRTTQRRRL